MGGGSFDGFDAVNLGYGRATSQSRLGLDSFEAQKRRRILYDAWLLCDALGAEYMRQVREHGLAVGFLSVAVRKHVVDWLEGKVQESDRIAYLTTLL